MVIWASVFRGADHCIQIYPAISSGEASNTAHQMIPRPDRWVPAVLPSVLGKLSGAPLKLKPEFPHDPMRQAPTTKQNLAKTRLVPGQ